VIRIERAFSRREIKRPFSRREIKRPKSDAGVRAVPMFASADEALRYGAARRSSVGGMRRTSSSSEAHVESRCTNRTSSDACGGRRITEAADRFDPARETRARQPSTDRPVR
jgi:hypothetical protein